MDPGRGLQSLQIAKAKLKSLEVGLMIKKGHDHGGRTKISGEIDVADRLFGADA